jgi:hypothetical protein
LSRQLLPLSKKWFIFPSAVEISWYFNGGIMNIHEEKMFVANS